MKKLKKYKYTYCTGGTETFFRNNNGLYQGQNLRTYRACGPMLNTYKNNRLNGIQIQTIYSHEKNC